MIMTYVQRGEAIDYTNPSTTAKIAAGTLIIIAGTHPAVAACDMAVGETGTVYFGHVVDGAKDTAAITLGADVYYNATSEVLTATASGNTKVGWCVLAAGATDTTVRIKLI